MRTVEQAVTNLIAALYYEGNDPKIVVAAHSALGDEGWRFAPVYQGLLKKLWMREYTFTDKEMDARDEVLAKKVDIDALQIDPAKVAKWCAVIFRHHTEKETHASLEHGLYKLEQGADVDEVIGETVGDLLSLQAPESTAQSGAESAKAEVELIRSGRSHELRIPVFLEPLQRATGGLKRANFALLAALPSHGKSALADEIVFRDAMLIKGKGLRACNVMISAESTKEDVLKAQSGRMKNLSVSDLTDHPFNPVWNDTDFDRMNEGIDEADALPVVINDQRGLGLDNIRATMQVAQAQHGSIRILMIDTLERVIPAGKKSSPDKEHKALIAGIEQLCKDFNCAGLVLHHLNRETHRLSDPRKLNDGFIRWGGESEAYHVIIPVLPFMIAEQMSDDAKRFYGLDRLESDEARTVGTFIITKDKGHAGRRSVSHKRVWFDGRLLSWRETN